MERNGFTLIELMIVVVIIAILAAIAIPKFAVASWQAKEKEAETMLKQVYQLHQAYTALYGSTATTEAQLQQVGFEPPSRLEYYQLPGADAYGLPLCLTSLGAWPSRRIDAAGSIDDC